MKKIDFKFEKDACFKSAWVAKLLNRLMFDGKKEIIEKEFYNFIILLKKNKSNGILTLFYAIEILRPVTDLIPAVRSGRTYEIGAVLSFRRQYFTALKWLASGIKNQKNKSMAQRIANELYGVVLDFKSFSLLKKKTLYRKIYKNRPFLRFRWK